MNVFGNFDYSSPKELVVLAVKLKGENYLDLVEK